MLRYFTYSTSASTSSGGNSANAGIAVPGMPSWTILRRSSSVGCDGGVGALELEHAAAIVARIGIEDRRRRAAAVAGDAVAVGTMAAIQAVLVARLVAPHGPGRHRQLALIEARFGHGERLVRRAEHGARMSAIALLMRGRNLLVDDVGHVEPKRRRLGLAAADRRDREQ